MHPGDRTNVDSLSDDNFEMKSNEECSDGLDSPDPISDEWVVVESKPEAEIYNRNACCGRRKGAVNIGVLSKQEQASSFGCRISSIFSAND